MSIGQPTVVKRHKTMYAKVILDSVSRAKKRLISIEVKYWRYIHAELMTHRAFARNAASSRAIPFHKLAARTAEDPFFPEVWPREQSGMQGGEAIDADLHTRANTIWAEMQAFNLKKCAELSQLGVHKSLCNRPLEWFGSITVLITATHYGNFKKLRCHPAAEPRFQTMASLVRDAISESVPRRREAGQWHLPYLQPGDETLDITTAKQVSTARCARLSYLTQDGVRSIDKDLELYDKLRNGAGDDQPHASPFEHPSMAMEVPAWSGPFFGWMQHRKELPNECAPEPDYEGPVLED